VSLAGCVPDRAVDAGPVASAVGTFSVVKVHSGLHGEHVVVHVLLQVGGAALKAMLADNTAPDVRLAVSRWLTREQPILAAKLDRVY
jgi:hypothetical protein